MRFSPTLILSTSALALTVGIATPAFAQGAAATEQPAATEQAAQEDQGTEAKSEAATGSEIVVTGSRIRRPDAFSTGENITVITREESTQAGFNTTTEALQSNAVTNGTAQINNTFGGFVTDGGPGANTLSLRGLGPTRTLLLLNGRRIAPAGTRGSVGSADLNVLPTAVIDRIEVLKAGASSIYGSDAVAGVVNVITRTKVKGLTLEAQQTLPEVGDGGSRRFSVLTGYNSDNWYINGTFEYYKRDHLRWGDRDWMDCQTDYRRTAADRTPGSGDFRDPLTGEPKCYPITGTGDSGVTINTIGTPTRAGVGAAGSVGSSFNRWRPNSAITTGLVGFEGVGGGANNSNVRDTLDPDIYNNSLISPAKTITGFLQAGLETSILGNAEVYTELLATRRKSSQTSFRQLTLDYGINSPLLPAQLQGLGTFLPAGGSEVAPGATAVRAFIGFGNTENSQKVDFVRFGAGFRGDFFLPDWRYDAYFGKSWTDSTYSFESFLTDRVRASLNPVAGPGGLVCAAAATMPGCVVAPFLNSQTIGGDLPQAYRDYILQDVVGTTKFRETTWAFGVDGPVLALPGGDLSVYLGAEYRKSSIDDTPPLDSQNGNLYNLTSATPTRGSDSVWEVFGEVELPLLRDMPFAYNLTVNASARYTDYKSYGSDKTWKIGGVYAPVKWLSFRGNVGTSYRAPALFEQFLGATSGFLSSQSDPCNNWDAPGVNPFRATNCASEGLPAGFQANSGVTVLTAGGAASGLEAETSKSWSVGLVLEPKFGDYGNISFAVDYFRTEVNNGVSRAGAANILSLCYDDPDFRAGGGFCNLVTRDPNNNRLTVNNNYVNLATDIVRGIDFNFRYTVPLFGGQFRFNAALTKFLDQASKLFETDPLDDVNGTVGNPKWTGSFDTSYKIGRFNFRYGLDWIQKTDSYEYLGLNPDTTAFYLETPDYFLHHASVQVDWKNFEVTAGVRNMFDKDPPKISSGFYNRVGNAPLYSGYDYLGRTFFVNVTAAFDKLFN